MTDRIRLKCQNPNHPFKQKWYWYDPKESAEYSNVPHLHSDKYCVSCASYLNVLKTLMLVAVNETPTLYGNGLIKTDREQLKAIVDEVFDEC